MLIVRLFVGPRLVSAAVAKTEDEAHAKSKAMSRRWRGTARRLAQDLRTDTEELRTIRVPVGIPLREIRGRVISEILTAVGGNAALAAEVLGTSVQSIRNHMARETAADTRAVA